METFITRREGSSSGGNSEFNVKFDYSKYPKYGGKITNTMTSINLKEFDFSNIVSMRNMFSGCASLQSLDLSSFDTSKVINMQNMFNGCNSLKTLYVRSEADKTKLTASNTFLPSACAVIVGKPS